MIESVIADMAAQITDALGTENLLILCLIPGSIPLLGQLLICLDFSLGID